MRWTRSRRQGCASCAACSGRSPSARTWSIALSECTVLSKICKHHRSRLTGSRCTMRTSALSDSPRRRAYPSQKTCCERTTRRAEQRLATRPGCSSSTEQSCTRAAYRNAPTLPERTPSTASCSSQWSFFCPVRSSASPHGRRSARRLLRPSASRTCCAGSSTRRRRRYRSRSS